MEKRNQLARNGQNQSDFKSNNKGKKRYNNKNKNHLGVITTYKKLFITSFQMFQANNFHDNADVNPSNRRITSNNNNQIRTVTITLTNDLRRAREVEASSSREHARPPD